jgi:dTDP-4-dehydrorhamnose 3,5-epimerase
MNAPLKIQITPTAIHDVLIIEPKVFGDERGWFTESFNAQDFTAATGVDVEFVQDNHSYSCQWTLRGLHYQLDETQGKLVRVTSGKIFDVVVDIRRSSPTYGQWVGIELSAINHRQLWAPPGVAHGFLVLSESAETLYKVTKYYDPRSEKSILWNDSRINIAWPIPLGTQLKISPKDCAGLSWDAAPKF